MTSNDQELRVSAHAQPLLSQIHTIKKTWCQILTWWKVQINIYPPYFSQHTLPSLAPTIVSIQTSYQGIFLLLLFNSFIFPVCTRKVLLSQTQEKEEVCLLKQFLIFYFNSMFGKSGYKNEEIKMLPFMVSTWKKTLEIVFNYWKKKSVGGLRKNF